MRKRAKKNEPLIVTQDAIRDFRRLTTADRLRWLDEMRTFLGQTHPEKPKHERPVSREDTQDLRAIKNRAKTPVRSLKAALKDLKRGRFL